MLTESEWCERERAHRDRVRPWIEPRLSRRRTGMTDPVDDFLFDYYMLSPGQLLTWHPGLGPVLAGASGRGRHYRAVPGGMTVDATSARASQLRRAVTILAATATRPPAFRCFGLHEWAMVTGLPPERVRHAHVPLRVRPAEVEEVVAQVGLACSHFDAYRFFTPSALARQRPLSREAQERDEQPGCVHAGMDLYRYAGQALPFVPSELVADCFELARSAREVDMRASPYDLSEQGLAPVAVETPAGRAEYVRLQQQLAARAVPLRARVIDALTTVITATSERGTLTASSTS